MCNLRYSDSRRTRFAALCGLRRLSGAGATSPANVFWATGFQSRLAETIGANVAAVVLPGADTSACGIVAPVAVAGDLADMPQLPDVVILYGSTRWRRSSEDLSMRESKLERVLEVAENADSFDDGIAILLRKLKLDAALVGWDYTSLGIELWRSARRVKTANEVRQLSLAVSEGEAIARRLFGRCTAGCRWQAVLRAAREQSLHAETLEFNTSGAGRESSLMSTDPDYRLQPGDLVRLDFGLRVGCYWADIGQTAVLGEPSERMKRRFRALQAGIEVLLDQTRAGVPGADLYNNAIQQVRDAGIPDYDHPHCGHALGLELYDGDVLAPGATEPLEEGMVVNIELPLYEGGWGGMQIEQTVRVTADGCDRLTNSGLELVQLG